jgi:di/tricarboxylate transporter
MIYLAAVIVIGTLVAMASGKVPPVLALGSGLAVAGVTRVASPGDLFAGLSNGGVITVAAMLVIAKGIMQTGIVTRATWWLLSTVTSARQALRRLLVPVGIASGLMNSTPLVAMLIPASKELEQTRNVPAREVLLPIAHVTTLAGSVTLIGTSSNLLIAGIAGSAGVHVEMLSFAAVALPVALVGWLVIYVTGPLILHGSATPPEEVAKSWRVEIPISSRALADGRRASALGLTRTQVFELEAIRRQGSSVAPTEAIEADDVLIFAATEAGVTALWGNPHFGLSPQRLYQASVSLDGRGTLRDLSEDADIRVIAAQTTQPFKETAAIPGATCFVTSASTEELRASGAVAIWQDVAGRTPQPRMTWIALSVLVAVVVAASFGLAPVELVSFSGALLMVLTGVLTPASAARALDWNVLFILAGSVGLGTVVVTSGLAAVIADGVKYVSAGSIPLVVIVFAVTTTLMTNVVTNSAAASILTPIAIGIATDMGLDPVTLLAVVATCISFTFLNPFAHQSNLMVMRPGGYTTTTFARFGTPVIIASIVTTCAVGSFLLII